MREEVLDHEDLMNRHDLDRTDVERAPFRHLLDHASAPACHRLTHQYRMHPALGELVSDCFYDGALHTVGHPELPGWDRLYAPVTWLDTGRAHRHRETRSGTSLVNHHEVRVIKKALTGLCRALTDKTIKTSDGQPLRVLVLTAYRKQMDELRRAVAGPSCPLLHIEVNTIDAVQGREADVTRPECWLPIAATWCSPSARARRMPVSAPGGRTTTQRLGRPSLVLAGESSTSSNPRARVKKAIASS